MRKIGSQTSSKGRWKVKFKLLISIFFLIMLIGCAPSPNPTEIQRSPTAVNKQVSLTPTNRLQITYVQNAIDQNFGKLYTIDVNCMTVDKICLGEPKLLLKTLEMPSREKNKPKGLLTDYNWSPDGNKIALISTGDILIGDMVTQEWVNVTNSQDIDEYQPKWSLDGRFIYYRACPRIIVGNYGGHGSCQIYRSNPTGNEKLALLGSIKDSIVSYDISPDGQKIIFSISGPFGTGDLLYQVNSDGTGSNQIAMGGVSKNTPSFSPDGQRIAFVRLHDPNSKEESDIIVKDLVSGEERNLTEEFGGMVFSPAFSPNGEWIAFESFDSELNVNIFLVSLEQERIIQVTQGNGETSPAWQRLSGQ
ncbi:MAG: PD40 domain-containing protein [Anaerolineales bacterium]|nr:PD40 domain-containing protein [Anaerolineales bacterium]